jgi:small subunit ribosomal protein S35
MINQYLHKHDETVLPAIMDAIMVRRLSGLHEETDDEIMNELQMAPIDDVDDRDFENDFEETHDTDNNEIDYCIMLEIML